MTGEDVGRTAATSHRHLPGGGQGYGRGMALTSERARLSAVLDRPRPGQVVWWVVGAVVAVAAFTAAAVAAQAQPGEGAGDASSPATPDAAGVVAAPLPLAA